MNRSLGEHPALSSEMEYLVTVVQELSLARDLDTVMKIVRAASRKLTGSDGATFVLRDNAFCYYADEDAISPLWKGSTFPIGTCISGWAMLNKQAVAIEDIYLDDRIPHDAYRPTFVKSLAMVPIRTIEPIGAIGNYWATTHLPSEGEIKLLQSLADTTAVAMENVKVYEELEQRVKDRTIDLEAANKSLEAYSHSVSHDLRAPLRSIKGFFEIFHDAVKSNLDEHQEETANRIFSNVTYMERLIDGLLAFSRMGRQKLSRSTVNMAEMVQELSSNFKTQETSRNIQFEIKELPAVQGDPMLLRQVWTNLISNAVKYTDKKATAHIEIGFVEDQDHVEYYVRDNGAGFDMKYSDRLFGVFQRMHTQREFEGIGIGLSIVEQIVLKHDGRIWVEAAVDKGATFHFELPKR